MENEKRRWAVLTRYGELGASSRLRFFLWREKFSALGVEACFSPFFTDGQLEEFYRTGHYRAADVFDSFRRRFAAGERDFDAALVEYEALPFFPGWCEKLFFGKRPYILDFDDDVWTKYEKIFPLRGKFDALVRRAAGVTVANSFLREKVSPLNSNVLYLPTPVERVAPEIGKFDRPTVVWIGSKTTREKYLETFAPVLRKLAALADYELLVVADATPHLPGVPFRFEKWNSSTQETLLARSHVGIMPLADDGFSRGKSAYKIIQYLAAGIPQVASPIGENRFVLKENRTGFFAADPDEWCDKIRQILSDTALAARLGAASRLEAENFTRSALWGKYRDFLLASMKTN